MTKLIKSCGWLGRAGQIIAALWLLGLIALIVNPTGQGAAAFDGGLNLPGSRWWVNLAKAGTLLAVATLMQKTAARHGKAKTRPPAA